MGTVYCTATVSQDCAAKVETSELRPANHGPSCREPTAQFASLASTAELRDSVCATPSAHCVCQHCSNLSGKLAQHEPMATRPKASPDTALWEADMSAGEHSACWWSTLSKSRWSKVSVLTTMWQGPCLERIGHAELAHCPLRLCTVTMVKLQPSTCPKQADGFRRQQQLAVLCRHLQPS